MLFSYNWLKDYIKEKLPSPEKLANLLTVHIFEVEEVKKAGKDWLLDIDILPNRAHDCLSHLGMAREIAAISGLTFKKPEISFREDNEIKTEDFIAVKVENKELCPRYTARVVKGVKVKDSPKEIQERLKVLGLQPINNIVDILNYVMLETGQPLHAFDFDKLEGKDKKMIIVRKAKTGEKIDTLDDKRYKLDKDILIISDKKDSLAIAGIKGGKKAEIGKPTDTIIIESANFEMGIIRQARQKLTLQTDASLRFEHKPDPNLTMLAINRAVHLIQRYCKGKVAQGVVDLYPKKTLPRKIKLDLIKTEKLLGVKIAESEIINILSGLNFEIIRVGCGFLIVEIPTFRQDVAIAEDLIEEIGRVYGLDKIPATLPKILASPPERNINYFWEDFAKSILKEAGFSEIYSYSFISEESARNFNLGKESLIEIENPISSEQKYLRPSLILNLLKILKENLKNFEEIKIFELGRIYLKKDISEKEALTGLIFSSDDNNFYLAKGMVDLLFQKLGVSGVWYDDVNPTPEDSKAFFWQKGKRAEIKIDGEEIGFLGEINSDILERLEISNKTVVFDLDFKKLQDLCSEEHEYRPISKFPAAIRDLAILIPKEEKVVNVLNEINRAGGILIRDVDLFDIYVGEGISQDKKNLAFHIIYQAEDKTLTKEEIDNLQEKIIKVLEKNPEWEVRK